MSDNGNGKIRKLEPLKQTRDEGEVYRREQHDGHDMLIAPMTPIPAGMTVARVVVCLSCKCIHLIYGREEESH